MPALDQIQSSLLENMERLATSPDPEDILAEIADSFMPIYDTDIISQWEALPAESKDTFDYRDKWPKIDGQENGSILMFMWMDLALYYKDQFLNAWQTQAAITSSL
jgi:hypothetical protein